MTIQSLFIKSDKQKNMLANIHNLREQLMANGERADREGKLATDSIEALLDIGYNKLTLPESYGGFGFSLYEAVSCQELLASYDAATALSIGWHISGIGDAYDAGQWSQEHLQRVATLINENRALMNRAVSEKATGSPTRGGRPQCEALRDGNDWVITGTKTYTSMSTALTHPIVAAWIPEKEAVGYFLVDATSDGVSIDETWDVMAMRGTASNDLVLHEVRVPLDALLEVSDGPKTIIRQNGWLVHIPAVYLGIAQAANDYAVDFAKNYQPNSLPHPISELPHIQQKIGEMQLKVMTARHFLYSAIEKFEQHPELVTHELAAAKLIVTNTAIEVVDLAMRIVGAQSLQMSNPLNRYYRDVRAGLHNPPMDDMTLMKLAKQALQ